MSNLIESIVKPQRLSVSRVKQFDSCKKQYKFNYIFKLPQKDQKHLIFGKFLHRVLEIFHQNKIDGSNLSSSKEMGVAFKTALEEYKNLPKDDQSEAYKIIDGYLKKTAAQTDVGNQVLAVEKKFNIQLNDRVVITGMIDIIENCDDGTILISDYKSTKNRKYLENDFFQLLTYAYVMLNENPQLEKVKTAYILLRHDFEYITKEFTREEIMTVPNKYIEYAKKIEQETEYNASPSVLCQWCSYLDKCDEGLKFLGKPKTIYGKASWIKQGK